MVMTRMDAWEESVRLDAEGFTTAEEVVALVGRMTESYAGFSDAEYHALRDSIWFAVLRAIAAGHPEAVAMAVAAVEADAIPFTRWYE